jgi:hypothetical protein
MVQIHFRISARRAIIKEKQARAGLLAEELEDARGRIRDEKQRLEDFQMVNEELQRQIAEEHLHGGEVCLKRLDQELDDLTQRFEDKKDIIVSLLKRDCCIFRLMLDNLALYLQNEVAILITALTISCKDFIRETDQQVTRSVHQGRFFQKTRSS